MHSLPRSLPHYIHTGQPRLTPQQTEEQEAFPSYSSCSATCLPCGL